MRLTSFLVAVFGFYPQYRALRTVLMGKGWIEGDWEREHKYNNRNLYVIEPLVESLLQVPSLCTILVYYIMFSTGVCSDSHSLHCERSRTDKLYG